MTINSDIQSTLDRINEIVATTNTTDFIVDSFAKGRLLITGSFDHAYYHELEIHFLEVGYLALPTVFNYPVISIASEEIGQSTPQIDLDDSDILFVVHEDPDFNGGRKHFVTAKGIKIVEGMVYYYHRENLEPGERIADWVEKKG